MIGLEYVLKLHNKTQQELADKLGIKQQNIDAWIKAKRKIPQKYLPVLSEMFEGLNDGYFQKELSEVDKLIIQKEKLKKELKPKIKHYQTKLVLSDNSEETDLEDIPIYEQKELNDIDIEIAKVKIIDEIRESISYLNTDYEIGIIEQIAKLIKHYGQEQLFIDTMDALSHYFDILPNWVGNPESDEFVEEFLKLANKHEKGEIN